MSAPKVIACIQIHVCCLRRKVPFVAIEQRPQRVRVRVRVRKWDVHIHCGQHFQFSVFEILVLFSFDLVFGPVE